MNEIDHPRLDIGYISGYQYTEPKKLLRLQIVTTEGSPSNTDAGFGDAFGQWCLIAPPKAPDADPLGKVKESAEGVAMATGGQRTIIATRDTRVFRFGQDVKGGEVALTNFFGNRLLLAEKKVALTCVGGSLSFNADSGTVCLTGIPAVANGQVPYLTIDRSSIGLVSPTGGASVDVRASAVTISGASLAVDVGSLSLGKGAADGVVLRSLMTATLVVLQAWGNTHLHLNPAATSIMTGPTSVPLVLPMMIASFSVKAAL